LHSLASLAFHTYLRTYMLACLHAIIVIARVVTVTRTLMIFEDFNIGIPLYANMRVHLKYFFKNAVPKLQSIILAIEFG